MLAWTLHKLRFDQRTVAYTGHDISRLRARLAQRRRSIPGNSRKLHLGCGDRFVPGWLNCDVSGSEFDVDLAAGRLPFPDGSADAIVSQHVIEHLDLREQLIPLLRELHRVCGDDGRVWLSCPDLAKVCAAYLHDRGQALVEDRRRRWPDYSLGGAPVQHFINDLFQARGKHRNLFDFEILAWALGEAGFRSVKRVMEADLLAAHPDFPPRRDDLQSLYVVAAKTAAPAGN
ncbi:class I SAM-dependent methyltransferase [Streptomyces sp. NPDC058718]|uniref:class I SAM-dependent methyltransferase n=1 Tax=Streptomyces sp. NPDC058718 TaxID=3346610 RepID=UPI0036C8E9BB